MTERRSFFAELKRRNVYKVAVAYAIVGWLLVQVATQVFPFLEIPNWFVRLVIILVAIGFPMALIIAWAFELTPEGIKRTEDVEGSARDASANRIWVYVAVIGAALSVGLFFIGRYTAGNTTPGHNASPARTEATTAIAQKSIAVLPLLEGTVRKQGDRVRIVAELINAADGIELWTRTFDRELKDIFAVQQEIAAAVASSLKTTLLGSEQGSSANPATKNTEAHNAYLQGHYYFQRRNLEDYRKAVSHYDEAIRLDPEYALAYAERSESWTLIGDLTGEGKTAWPKARSDAEKAAAIAPALAEAHAALGWVRFFTEWKFSEGLTELKRAKELSPANPTANDLLARVIVYVGKPDEAEKQARQAVESDPLANAPQTNLARVLWYEGKLDEADAVARKGAELQPNSASSRRWQVLVAIKRGDIETALREAQLEPDESYRRFELALAQYARE